MNINITVDELAELEYGLLINMLGVLTALSEKCINIDDAERLLFQPKMAQVAEEINLNPRLVRQLWLGTELEDIESLLPERLQANIDEMKLEILSILSEIPKPDMPISSFNIYLNDVNYQVFRDYTKDEVILADDDE